MSQLVEVENCPIDSIILQDIYKENSLIPLVGEQTKFTERIREKLLDNGIFEIYVEIEEKDNLKEEISKNDLRKQINKNDSFYENKDLTFSSFKEKYSEHLGLLFKIFRHLELNEEVKAEDFDIIFDYYYENIDNLGSIIKYINKNFMGFNKLYKHSLNVGIYSIFIGKLLKFKEKELKRMFVGSLIHDIGTIVNNKKEEKHPIYGYELIKNKKIFSSEIKKIILLHHESCDGCGHPKGLKENEIPLMVKIVSIVDNYDMLISQFSKEKNKSMFDVFQELLELGYKSKIDLELTIRFVRIISELYVGSKIKFKNGKEGYIEFIPPRDIRHPLVRVKDKIFDTSTNLEYKNFIFV